MQLASHGARAIARKAPNIHNPSSTARGIHIPSAVRPQATNLGHRLLSQTRAALTRFVTHLTAPGLGSNPVSLARSFRAVNPSIQQRLSFAARTTLSRGLGQGAPFLPRAPVVPRTMTQVGLGTARNFSSGRPIFAQLAENVPIAGRAFYEADWEVEMRREQENMRRPVKAAKAVQGKEMLQPALKTKKSKSAKKTTPEAELEHYFPAQAVPAVTTHLLIPLTPPRAPLPEFPSASSVSSSLSADAQARLPLPSLLALHDAHATHALRVSSLFHRLDNADVWSRGARCDAYASSAGGGAAGPCTVLKVEFAGWSMAAVRGVIGESGTGWCVLEETASIPEEEEDEDAFSETSSALSGIGVGVGLADSAQQAFADPAQSLVLPTLDFSAGFRSHWSSPASSPGAGDAMFVDPPSENGWFESHLGSATSGSGNPWLSDSDSDSELEWVEAVGASRSSSRGSRSDDGWTRASHSSAGSQAEDRSWLGFSAGFAGRIGREEDAEGGPRESLFA